MMHIPFSDFHSNATKRQLFLFVVGFLFSLFSLRVAHLQIVSGESYRARADDNRFFNLSLPAPRGVFLSRFGNELVQNDKQYAQRNIDEAAAQRVTELSREAALPLLATSAGDVTFSYQRRYPYAESLAHVLGYLGPVTVEDLQQREGLRPDAMVGKMGLEAVFDARLQGQAGTRVIEIDALGRQQRVVSEKPPKIGESFKTTLDPYLSTVAYEALGDKKGTVIIGDITTGGILAMVSKPSFDPNVLSNAQSDAAAERLRRQQVREWLLDPEQRFFNRGIAGAYPPGSLFKLVTALSGLQAGAFDENSTVVDEGVLEVGEFSFANWYYTQYGRTEGEIGLVRSIARSNDIFFYKAAEWTGPSTLAESARLLGMGEKTGIELTGEARGLVPDPQWKEETIGERWYLGNTYHLGIGQGDLTATPLQLWSMMQGVATKGRRCDPHVLQTRNSSALQRCGQVGIAEEHFEPVLQGMIDACSSGGTAFPFFPHNATILANGGEELARASAQQKIEAGMMACKTGTAEFGGENEDGFRNTHAWFGGVWHPKVVAATAAAAVPNTASSSADVSASTDELDEDTSRYETWLSSMQGQEYPHAVGIMVLIESDENKQYREGSQDAAPVAASIVEWMKSGTPVSASIEE